MYFWEYKEMARALRNNAVTETQLRIYAILFCIGIVLALWQIILKPISAFFYFIWILCAYRTNKRGNTGDVKDIEYKKDFNDIREALQGNEVIKTINKVYKTNNSRPSDMVEQVNFLKRLSCIFFPVTIRIIIIECIILGIIIAMTSFMLPFILAHGLTKQDIRHITETISYSMVFILYIYWIIITNKAFRIASGQEE